MIAPAAKKPKPCRCTARLRSAIDRLRSHETERTTHDQLADCEEGNCSLIQEDKEILVIASGH